MMSSGASPLSINACWDDFQDTYCVRKVAQLLLSTLMLIVSIFILARVFCRQRARQYSWLIAMTISLSCSLLVNIIFCFLSAQYWLYALEAYFYNLYYLFLVAYVAKSYILKYRQIINFRKYMLDPLNQTRKLKDQRTFYVIFTLVNIIYLAILIASLVLEITSKGDFDRKTHCQQIWYLCFEGLCLLLSFIVLFTLLRNQKEESKRLSEFKGQNSQGKKLVIQQESSKINNPLRKLVIWISLNVLGQLTNVIQSIFYLMATPPECLIIQDSEEISNILELIFAIITMYLCFGSTIVYFTMSASVQSQHFKSRLSESDNRQVHIELLPPLSRTASTPQ